MDQGGQSPGGTVGFMVMRVGTETALNRNNNGGYGG